jgi:mannose-6-phosphate isomerase
MSTPDNQRPWGYYEILSEMNDHKVKRIVVYPNKRLSLQKHRRRSEHWIIVSGNGIVTTDDLIIPVNRGKSVDISVNMLHRIENTGSEDLVFIEVQYGDYFGEDDIERVEDDFGRA